MTMISIAYLMFRIMKRGVISPIRARNSTSVGSWKTMPNASISRRYSANAGSIRGMNVTMSVVKLAKNPQRQRKHDVVGERGAADEADVVDITTNGIASFFSCT